MGGGGAGACVRACVRVYVMQVLLFGFLCRLELLVIIAIVFQFRSVVSRVLNLTASVQRTGLRVYVRGSR